jgi:hypothetical protein
LKEEKVVKYRYLKELGFTDYLHLRDTIRISTLFTKGKIKIIFTKVGAEISFTKVKYKYLSVQFINSQQLAPQKWQYKISQAGSSSLSLYQSVPPTFPPPLAARPHVGTVQGQTAACCY